ncbi:TonB family protein [Tritonibacter mobilis]|uniref:TonB family protein n=1 Tax=Tritonibacter mobilis TaxID=379347 RepID=UPI003A5BB456
MIARSPLIACVSLFCALAAHAALLVDLEETAVEIEGGDTQAPAALGSSFADLVQGTATTVEADAARHTTPVDPVPPALPTQVSATPLAPVTTPASAPTSAEVSASVKPALPPVTEASPSPIAAAVAPVEAPAPEVQPDRAEALDSASELAPQESPRPLRRPEAAPQARDEVETQAPAAPAPRGNSTVNARAGSETGAEQQRASQAASTRPAAGSGAGNAAASNYPGQVMRKISRVRKPRTSVRGVAYVSFVIGSGGQLASVRIRKSSGSTELDQLALQQIRRAAPFPPPPVGARTQYSIAIKGR